MATAEIVNCSPYGLVCTECDDLVIAPDCSEYVGEREVGHFWSCESCGHKIRSNVDLRVSFKAKSTERTRLRPMALVA
jgi:ABC-type ATPase with predicted acetyltransferase domain